MLPLTKRSAGGLIYIGQQFVGGKGCWLVFELHTSGLWPGLAMVNIPMLAFKLMLCIYIYTLYKCAKHNCKVTLFKHSISQMFSAVEVLTVLLRPVGAHRAYLDLQAVFNRQLLLVIYSLTVNVKGRVSNITLHLE